MSGSDASGHAMANPVPQCIFLCTRIRTLFANGDPMPVFQVMLAIKYTVRKTAATVTLPLGTASSAQACADAGPASKIRASATLRPSAIRIL